MLSRAVVTWLLTLKQNLRCAFCKGTSCRSVCAHHALTVSISFRKHLSAEYGLTECIGLLCSKCDTMLSLAMQAWACHQFQQCSRVIAF